MMAVVWLTESARMNCRFGKLILTYVHLISTYAEAIVYTASISKRSVITLSLSLICYTLEMLTEGCVILYLPSKSWKLQ